ncbi:MAG: FxLYD domain-containing protein [Thermoanaerobaculum sp.]
MKRGLLVALVAVLSASAWAATVVLKGGKKLEVASYEQKGNYLVVTLVDGTRASYPLSVVDLAATAHANAQPTPAAAPATPEAPRSPFARAVAKPGTPAAHLTDADVQKVAPAGGEAPGEEGKEPPAPAREEGVVVLGWSGREAGEGQWEITANLLNQGKVPVQDVAVAVRAVADGKTLGTGSATYPGRVEPGQQFTVPVTVSAPEAPKQVVFSLNWRQVTPIQQETPAAPTPQPTPSGGGSES